MNKRKSLRRKMVLGIKVSIDNVTHLAHTIDITNVGARLGGLRTQFQPGAVIRVQRGSKKAGFRVLWIRQLTPIELQAGIEALEPQNSFWEVDLSDQQPKNDMKTLLTLLYRRS